MGLLRRARTLRAGFWRRPWSRGVGCCGRVRIRGRARRLDSAWRRLRLPGPRRPGARVLLRPSAATRCGSRALRSSTRWAGSGSCGCPLLDGPGWRWQVAFLYITLLLRCACCCAAGAAFSVFVLLTTTRPGASSTKARRHLPAGRPGHRRDDRDPLFFLVTPSARRHEAALVPAGLGLSFPVVGGIERVVTRRACCCRSSSRPLVVLFLLHRARGPADPQREALR